MQLTPIDPLPWSYSQGVLVEGARRTLLISGQIPATRDGTVPEGFEDQCRLAWQNVQSVLSEAGMTLENLVKVTIYLSDRRYRAANGRIRQEILGAHSPALTIIITGIYDEAWLLEIEAIAAD